MTGNGTTVTNNYYVVDGSPLTGALTTITDGTNDLEWNPAWSHQAMGLTPVRSQIPLPEGADAIRSKLPKVKAKPYFRFENAATDSADVFIYDEITDPFWAEFGMGISANSFAKELAEHKGKALTVHINSPGGSVFEGTAIYNLLRGHDGPVNVIVDGIAASIASVIAMAGDTVTMAPHSMLMIHDAWGITMGNAADHEQQAKVLNKLSDNIAAVYRERGDSRKNWRALMLAETWITDEEAVALKLADRVDTSVPTAANNFDLSRYRNVPEDLQASADDADRTPTKRNAEQALRDAGFSAREAKVILASGWKDEDARDETDESDQIVSEETTGKDSEPITGTVVDAEEIARRHEARLRELELMGMQLA
jgi:ATP-dependent protease ClpP protease subunit